MLILCETPSARRADLYPSEYFHALSLSPLISPYLFQRLWKRYTTWITEGWRVLLWSEPSAKLFWEMLCMYHCLSPRYWWRFLLSMACDECLFWLGFHKWNSGGVLYLFLYVSFIHVPFIYVPFLSVPFFLSMYLFSICTFFSLPVDRFGCNIRSVHDSWLLYPLVSLFYAKRGFCTLLCTVSQYNGWPDFICQFHVAFCLKAAQTTFTNLEYSSSRSSSVIFVVAISILCVFPPHTPGHINLDQHLKLRYILPSMNGPRDFFSRTWKHGELFLVEKIILLFYRAFNGVYPVLWSCLVPSRSNVNQHRIP